MSQNQSFLGIYVDIVSFLCYNLLMQNNIDINIELGLQSVNYHTLDQINRGHGLAEYIDAVLRIKK